MEEQWRPAGKDLQKYEVSDQGRVRNIKSDRILKTHINQKGYEVVCLSDDKNKIITKRVHRLVADAFCDGEYVGHDVIHKDGKLYNNRADNLEWQSRAETIGRTFLEGRRQTHRMKKVRHVETGRVYDSVVDCSKATGINRHSISKCANNNFIRTRDGQHFEFVD